MTNLTEELERLNELDAKRTQGEYVTHYMGDTIYIGNGEHEINLRTIVATIDCDRQYDEESIKQRKDNAAFIAAAPDAIALANKLHELLVQAEAALMWVHSNSNGVDSSVVVETLTALHEAGIGRE